MDNKAILLLSAGLDSTVNFYQALQELNVILALTFDYGQKAAKKEIAAAAELCRQNKIPHQAMDVRWFKDFTQTSLVNSQSNIPTNMQIDNLQECTETAKSVWVPNRNGIMINIAAGYAEGLGAKYIIVGFNKEEAATFPDNSPEYLSAVNLSLSYSTLKKVEVKCYTTDFNKTQIVELGTRLQVPFAKIWSCYLDGETPCQECESCLRFQRALGRS